MRDFLSYKILFFFFLPGIIFGQSKTEKFQNPMLLSINGYVHVQWMYDLHDYAYPRYGFILRRARLEFRHELSDVLATEIEIGCDKLALMVKDAYFEYKVHPLLHFTAGLHKIPFSNEELTPISKILMIERSIANDKFSDYKYLGRDIGLTLKGELLKHNLPITYALGVYNGNGDRIFKDNNNAKQFAERITLKPIKNLKIGLNATQRNDSLTGSLVNAFGGDVVYRFGKSSIETELLYANTTPDQKMFSGYVMGGYRFAQFEPCLRLERLYPDLDESTEHSTIVTTGCNYHLHRKVQIKANLITDVLSDWQFAHKLLIQAQVSF